MKKLFVSTVLALGSLFITVGTQAQVRVNVSIVSQPAWAPAGYDNAQYYYLPDPDVYYDVPAHQFLYLSNGRWVRATTLPAAYRSYDLYKVHKVALNKKDAYRNHGRDKQQYANFKGRYDQSPIRDSRDDKYAGNRNNWKNDRFAKDEKKGNPKKESRHDNGRHSGS